MALDTPAQRLQWARKQHGKFPQPTEAARAFNWKVSTYLGHENGDRNPSRDAAKKYAAAYKVRWEWLLEGEGSPSTRPLKARIVGRVGAGNAITPIGEDDPGLGSIPLTLPPDAIPVRVDGDSMRPRYFDGEHVIYLPEQRDPSELIGRECVVQLIDGRVFVKILRRGNIPGRFNLESWNADPIENQEVEWASPVRWRASP